MLMYIKAIKICCILANNKTDESIVPTITMVVNTIPHKIKETVDI